jgi:hypothetical protein
VRRLLIALLLACAPLSAWAQCVSNCADNTACDWNTAGSWTAGTGCTTPPNLATEPSTIGAGDTIVLNTDGLTVGPITINGTLSYSQNAAARDADGFMTLTITAGDPTLNITATGRVILRAGDRIVCDSTLGVCENDLAYGAVWDAEGQWFDTTIAAITDADAAVDPCGTTNGRLWIITPESGMEYAKAKRRIVFKSGTARTIHMEIIAVSVAAQCKASGVPFSCCTALDTGATCDGSQLAVCTNLADGTSCAAGTTPADDQNSCGQRLTKHTATQVPHVGTVAGGVIYRDLVPMYEPTESCTAADAPFDCCIRAYTAGDTHCDEAKILPEVGDAITIIDDVWLVDSGGNGFNLGSTVVGSGAGTGGNDPAPIIRAVNWQGIGDSTPHNGMYVYAGDVDVDGEDFLYNNLHQFTGESVAKWRGFKNFNIQWNACHDPIAGETVSNGACIMISSSTQGSNGPVTTSTDNVTISENHIYGFDGDGVRVNDETVDIYGTGNRVISNLIHDGCLASDSATASCTGIRVSNCRGCDVTHNAISDLCETAATGGAIVADQSDGIALISLVTTTTPDDIGGADNILAGSGVHHNRIVNTCDNGISIHKGSTANNAAQQVWVTANYISHTRNSGIEGGRAFANVIANWQMVSTANAGDCINNPVEADGNYCLGADDVLAPLGDGAYRGIYAHGLAGNTNGLTVTYDDNIVTDLDNSGTKRAIKVESNSLYDVTLSHNTADGDGLAARVFQIDGGSTAAVTWTCNDYAATHTLNMAVGWCSADVDVTDNLGNSAVNISPVAVEDTGPPTSGTCSATGTAVYVAGLYPGRSVRDYNLPAGSAALTGGASPAGSPLGVRAFRFDRNAINDVWGGVLPFMTPFPANVCNLPDEADGSINTDCIDSDGDGIVNLHDNCDFTPNPSQYDGDGDGKGCACDNGDNCP